MGNISLSASPVPSCREDNPEKKPLNHVIFYCRIQPRPGNLTRTGNPNYSFRENHIEKLVTSVCSEEYEPMSLYGYYRFKE
jgi:hypothetical protein